MSENEILARGIVAGMAMVIPFLGIAVARWHSWKFWCNFWQEQNKFAHNQINQLSRALRAMEKIFLKVELKCRAKAEEYK